MERTRHQPDLHHIQKSVLLSLATQSPQRFSELQPPRVPNNTFSYHLKKLLDFGYVELSDKGYSPTRKALKHIGMNGAQRQYSAPILLTMLYITNDNGEVLLINRNTRPFQGWYGLPSGMIHVGESFDQAAQRELHEKTPIQTDQPLQQVGVLDFQYVEDETNDIFVHAVAFIYTLALKSNTTTIDDASTKYGQLSWSMLGRKHILPEVFAVHDIVEHPDQLFTSVKFQEPPLVSVVPDGDLGRS